MKNGILLFICLVVIGLYFTAPAWVNLLVGLAIMIGVYISSRNGSFKP